MMLSNASEVPSISSDCETGPIHARLMLLSKVLL